VIHLEVTVQNAAELLAAEAYGPGALLRWESAALQAGPWAEGGTVALVSGTTVYDVWDSAGLPGVTWYRTRVSDSGGTTFSAFTAPRLGGTGSTVTPEMLMALVSTTLSEQDVQALIDREEAALARQVTQLAGSRVQVYYIGDPAMFGLYLDPVSLEQAAAVWILPDRYGPLGLLRPTDGVVVVDNDVTLDAADVRLLRGGTQVERASGGWDGPIVTVTYTPNDYLEVQRVVIELCRTTMTETGYQSERIGDYQYARGPGAAAADRKRLVRSLLTHGVVGTTRVHSSSEYDRVGGAM
jgi:hypothetical protein